MRGKLLTFGQTKMVGGFAVKPPPKPTTRTYLFVVANFSLLLRCTPSLSFKRLISAERAVRSVFSSSDAFEADES